MTRGSSHLLAQERGYWMHLRHLVLAILLGGCAIGQTAEVRTMTRSGCTKGPEIEKPQLEAQATAGASDVATHSAQRQIPQSC